MAVVVPRVFTQACLHAGWHNDDSVPRKAFIMSWIAKGVPGGMEKSRIEGIRGIFPEVCIQCRLYRQTLCLTLCLTHCATALFSKNTTGVFKPSWVC